MKKTGAEKLDKSSESTAEQPAQGDLLPCPFCGEPPSEYVNFTWNIECLANEASCNRAYVYADTKEEVRKLWNTRADLQPEQPPQGDYSGTITDLRCLANHFYETEQNQAADMVRGAAEIIESLAALQPEPDTVRISRECALEALHAMQNDQARPDFQCGELNEAIGQLKQALESGHE